jgi:hypothetical protein
VSWTKKQLIEEAYGELALAGYVFDLEPEEMQTALRRLDTMIATWTAKGINLGYPLPSSPDASNLDDDSNLPDLAIEPVYMNLAVRLAAGGGKQLHPSTLTGAKTGYDMLLGRAAMPIEQQLPNTLPRGAGNKPWRGVGSPFMPEPTDPLADDGDGAITT